MNAAHAARPSRERPALLRWAWGPWTPWIRDPADLIRLSLLGGVVAMLVVGDYENALRLALTFLVTLVPRLIAMPLPFDLAFGAAMSLQAWGNVSRAFWTWSFYHDIVHLTLTMATAILFYFVLVFLRLTPDISRETHVRQKLGIAVFAFAIGSTVNAIYEEYEWFAVHVMHANLLEYYGHDIHDLLFGGLGGVLAGVWLAIWSGRRWRWRRQTGDDPLDGLRRRLERRMAHSARDPDGSSAAWRRRRESPPHSAPQSLALTWLFLRDWSQPVRDLADVGRLALLVGLVLAAHQGNWDLIARFGLTLLLTLAVRRINAPRAFDIAFTGALLFQAWGAYAGALRTVPGFDAWTNFVVSFGCTPILYVALIRAHVFPEFADEPGIHRHVAVMLAAVALGFCAGIYYELYVWVANHHLGANVPTSWTGLTARLALDWGGSFAGGLALLAWDAFGWGTRRRVQPPAAGAHG